MEERLSHVTLLSSPAQGEILEQSLSDTKLWSGVVTEVHTAIQVKLLSPPLAPGHFLGVRRHLPSVLELFTPGKGRRVRSWQAGVILTSVTVTWH